MAPRIKYDRVAYVDPQPGKDDAEVLWSSKCPRCGGSGEFREYDHIENGVCFECRGDKSYTFEFTVGMDRRDAKRVNRLENKGRLDKAKAAQYLADAVAVRPEWATLTKDSDILQAGFGESEYDWTENRDFNQFIFNLWNQLQGFGKFGPKPLSEKQIEAGANAIQRHHDKVAKAADAKAAKATVAPVVEGKQIIAGVVYGAKLQDSIYGSTFKFGIRQVNGQTYWGTIPAKLIGHESLATGNWETKLNGTNVVLEATVSPAREDHTHGFYKRPKLISADLLNS